MADRKTIGSEWSEAYLLATCRQDSCPPPVLYLLGLTSWPPLTRMYGDLVEDLTLICTLLSKRPMVGYLIARRLGLEREKTQVLLSILEEKGYVRAVGVHLLVNKHVNKHVFGASQIQLPGPVKSTHATEFSTYTSTNTKAADTAAVLSQLWRVLNAEIAFKRQSNVHLDSESETETDASREAADVMSQLWRVLNTEIASQRRSNPNADSKSATDIGREAADRLSQLWRVLHAEIAMQKAVKPWR